MLPRKLFTPKSWQIWLNKQVQSGSVNVFGQIWNLMQKDVLNTDVAPFGALTITDTSSAAGESKSGNWSIDTIMTVAYSLFLIALKPDNGHAYYNGRD